MLGICRFYKDHSLFILNHLDLEHGIIETLYIANSITESHITALTAHSLRAAMATSRTERIR